MENFDFEEKFENTLRDQVKHLVLKYNKTNKADR